MSNNRRLFGFGILTGAAIGYWLNTDKGKAFRKDVATMVGEYSDEISALAKDNALKLGSNFSTAMEDGQTWVSGAKGKLKTSIHELADTVDHTVDEVAEKLETGLEKARKKVNENTARLENGKGKEE
ncbi:MAG: YtxH domain-containing protein [Phaeodactylibacter sp.]|nr:YtxH domain-containing protein [Phaeodactylibacter sp.]